MFGCLKCWSQNFIDLSSETLNQIEVVVWSNVGRFKPQPLFAPWVLSVTGIFNGIDVWLWRLLFFWWGVGIVSLSICLNYKTCPYQTHLLVQFCVKSAIFFVVWASVWTMRLAYRWKIYLPHCVATKKTIYLVDYLLDNVSLSLCLKYETCP